MMGTYGYCGRYTILTITGEPEQILLLQKNSMGVTTDFDGDEMPMVFSLESLIPSPDELKLLNKIKPNGISNDNIYKFDEDYLRKWRLENWGVGEDNHWCNVLNATDYEWKIYFETWQHFPDEALIKISKVYPELKFAYSFQYYGDNYDYGVGTIINGTDEWRGWWPDKDGYDDEGYQMFTGFNRDGLCEDGSPYNSHGFDVNGFDRLGFGENGFNCNGIHRDTQTKYDRRGYDQDGYDSDGGHNKDCIGFHNGFNKCGIHTDTLTIYDRHGFDKNGYDADGNQDIPF